MRSNESDTRGIFTEYTLFASIFSPATAASGLPSCPGAKRKAENVHWMLRDSNFSPSVFFALLVPLL